MACWLAGCLVVGWLVGWLAGREGFVFGSRLAWQLVSWHGSYGKRGISAGPDNACKHASAACRQGPIFVGRKEGSRKKMKKRLKKKENNEKNKKERGNSLI